MLKYLILAAAIISFPRPAYAEFSPPQYTMNSKASIEDYIISRAMAYNYRPDLAAAIAKAESGFDVDAKSSSSSASGLFQFINGTFKGFCIEKYKLATSTSQKNDPFVQTECAVKMLAAGGESHWSESEPSWGKIK